MTTDTSDHSRHGAVQQAAPGEGGTRQARSPWLLPGIAVGIAATVLVIAGVISVTTLVYVGVIGGMLFMHLGHGAHALARGATAATIAPSATTKRERP